MTTPLPDLPAFATPEKSPMFHRHGKNAKTSSNFMFMSSVRKCSKMVWRPWWPHLWAWLWIRYDHSQEDVSFPAWSQTQGTGANTRPKKRLPHQVWIQRQLDLKSRPWFHFIVSAARHKLPQIALAHIQIRELIGNSASYQKMSEGQG